MSKILSTLSLPFLLDISDLHMYLKSVGVQYRRRIIEGLLLYWFMIRTLSKSNIGVEHVTNAGNDKHEDFPFFRRVNIFIYW